MYFIFPYLLHFQKTVRYFFLFVVAGWHSSLLFWPVGNINKYLEIDASVVCLDKRGLFVYP